MTSTSLNIPPGNENGALKHHNDQKSKGWGRGGGGVWMFICGYGHGAKT